MSAAKRTDSHLDTRIWHGRFDQCPAERTQTFVESLSFDRRLYKHDIAGSIAHARMLNSVGLISQADLRKIVRGLKTIAQRISTGKFDFADSDEDIHMAVEAALIRSVGSSGKKLHTARSRNDQVALDLRLYLRDAIDLVLLSEITKLQAAFVELASRQGMVPMPGFTHLQPAQPILAAAALLAQVEQLERDRDRLIDCRKRIDHCPLGACALAGTALPIDRKFTAAQLGFKQLCRNSIDAVSDRDFAVEFVFDLSMIAMHLSQWAEQWIVWSTPQFGFVVLSEAYCTGSSIMPQKCNPDVLELIRGKSAGVYGQLFAMLAMLKGLAGAYNRDLQEDKRWVFQAYDTVIASLRISTDLVAATQLNADAMANALSQGYLEATALAEYLVLRAVPFRDAHQIVGRIVAYCEKKNQALAEMTLDEFKKFYNNIASDVYRTLDPDKIVRAYRSAGSAGTKEVRKQLRFWERTLSARS